MNPIKMLDWSKLAPQKMETYLWGFQGLNAMKIHAAGFYWEDWNIHI